MKLRILSNSFLLLFSFFSYVKPIADLPTFNKIVSEYKKALDYKKEAERAILGPQLIKLYDNLLHINADCDTTLHGHRLTIDQIRKIYTPQPNNDKLLAEQNRLKLLEEQRLLQAHQAFLAQEKQRAEQERLNRLAQAQAQQTEKQEAERLLAEKQRLEREEAQRTQAKLAQSIAAEQERQRQLKAAEDKILADKQRLDAEKARIAQELKSAQDSLNKELQEKLKAQELIAKDLENKLASERANLISEKAKSEQNLKQHENQRKELADQLRIAQNRLEHERAAIAQMSLKSNPYESLKKAITVSDVKQVEYMLSQYKPNKAQKEDLLKLSQDAIAKRSTERLTGIFNGNTLAGAGLIGGSIYSHRSNVYGNLPVNDNGNLNEKVIDALNKIRIKAFYKPGSDKIESERLMNEHLKAGADMAIAAEAHKVMTDHLEELKKANNTWLPEHHHAICESELDNKISHINYLNLALGGLGAFYVVKGIRQAWDKYNKAREIRNILVNYQYAD